MMTRLQVLAATGLAFSVALPCAVLAQPPDAGAVNSNEQPALAQQPPPLPPPLLPIKLDEWLAMEGGMTTLKLKMEQASGEEIAEAVQRQTGLPIQAAQGMERGQVKGPRYSVEAGGQPFWEAIRNWSRGEQKLSFAPTWAGNGVGNNQVLTLTISPMIPGGRALPLGPFTLIASSITASSSAQRSIAIDAIDDEAQDALTQQSQSSLQLQTSLLVDPKLAQARAEHRRVPARSRARRGRPGAHAQAAARLRARRSRAGIRASPPHHHNRSARA